MIKYIAENTDIELEAFIHGALCMSLSGQCYASAFLGGRSGNRGRCAGKEQRTYSLRLNCGTPEGGFGILQKFL